MSTYRTPEIAENKMIQEYAEVPNPGKEEYWNSPLHCY